MAHVPSLIQGVRTLSLQQTYDDPSELETFAPFSELPIEIRLHIWKIAVPRGRILRFNIDFERNQYRIRGRFSRVPTIMHVCRESREVGLQDFRCGFPHLEPQNGGVYWSESDTLLYVPGESVSWDSVYGFLSVGIHKILPMVRHLAIPLSRRLLESIDGSWMEELVNGLRKRDGLTTLSFVLDPVRNLRIFHPSAIALEEALDVPVDMLSNQRPSSIEADIVSASKIPKLLATPTRRLPIIECLVAGPRRFKRSRFCVGLERGVPPDQRSENLVDHIDPFWD